MKELNQAKAQVKALKEEVSEKDKLYEARGKELTAARKQAAKADDLQAELDAVNAKVEALEKAAAAAAKERDDLAEKLAKTNGILDDVAALKRLVA